MKKTVLASLVAVAMIPAFSYAADGKIDFGGEIGGQTCKINNGNPNMSVTLPKVSASSLATAGQTAGNTVFTVKLTECNPATGGARVFFEAGPTVDLATGRLKLDTSSTAKNVQISVANTNGDEIKIGQPNGATNPFISIASGSADLTYLARYYSQGNAQAGTTKTNVMYTIEYQ